MGWDVRRDGSVAQWLKHLLTNPRVVGSNPALVTLGKVSENQFLGSTHAMGGELGSQFGS